MAAEVRGKSPACGSLHSGRGGGGSFSRRPRSQPLQARLIALLQTLLALEQAVLILQQPFLRALRPETSWLLRLQLLHPLLHAIYTVLTLCALARQHVTLPLLYNLLSLLDALLTLRRPRFDLSLSRRSRARNGRCAWVRRCGDTWLRVSRHRWALRRRGAMDLGSRRCDAWRGWSWRGRDARRRLRGHSWTLWRGSRTERRRGGPRHHCRRCRRARHTRWWSSWSGCWRSRAPGASAT
jgi:hypothetical protein